MPLIRMRCATCKGPNVQVDAYGTWDFENQAWVVESTFDKGAVCADCDGETRIEEIEYLTRNELLKMLDNVSAAADNMLGALDRHDDLTPEDKLNRARLIEEARKVCDDELRSEQEEE